MRTKIYLRLIVSCRLWKRLFVANLPHLTFKELNGKKSQKLSYLVIAFPIFSLRLKFGIKRISSLFKDVFYKDKENSRLNMIAFDQFSC